MKKTKISIIIVMPILIFIIGFTIAYYFQKNNFNNEFNSTIYGSSLIKNCNPPEKWWAGDTYTCEISGKNKSDIDVALRIIVAPRWYKDNTQISNTFTYTIYDEELDEEQEITEDFALINFVNQGDWIDGGTIEKEIDYDHFSGEVYYYKNKLSKNESTKLLTDKVTYNINAVNSNCQSYSESSGCIFNEKYYGDFNLQFIVETVQYDAYRSVWETDVVIN